MNKYQYYVNNESVTKKEMVKRLKECCYKVVDTMQVGLIGIDTVELNGKGFKPLVKQGDVVKAGDSLVEVDFDVLKNEGKDPTCMIIFPNKEKFSIVKPHSHVTTGQDNIIEFNN